MFNDQIGLRKQSPTKASPSLTDPRPHPQWSKGHRMLMPPSLRHGECQLVASKSISNALHTRSAAGQHKLTLIKRSGPEKEWQLKSMVACLAGKDQVYRLSLPSGTRACKASPSHFLLLQPLPGRVSNPSQSGHHIGWFQGFEARHPNHILRVGCDEIEHDGEA